MCITDIHPYSVNRAKSALYVKPMCMLQIHQYSILISKIFCCDYSVMDFEFKYSYN